MHSICTLQRIENDLSLVVLRNESKGMVDRRLDYDFIALLRQAVYHHADTLHNSGYVTHPLAFYIPVVTSLEPRLYALPITIILKRVTKYRMVESLSDCLDYEVGRFEIHIGNPQWNKILSEERLLHAIVLDAVCATARGWFIKVVNFVHRFNF